MGVPGSTHYQAQYLGSNFERLSSYREQLLHAALHPPAQSALIVGKGDDLVPGILRGRGLQVTTLDISPELNPDLVGSVDAIPCGSGSFDVAICCQVLEHLPFSSVSKAMHELCRVSRRRVVISVPDNRRFFSMQLRFLRWDWHMQASLERRPLRPIPSSRLDALGHHWEVGFAGYTLKAVGKQLTVPGWRVSRSTRVHAQPWHLFLVFDSDGAER